MCSMAKAPAGLEIWGDLDKRCFSLLPRVPADPGKTLVKHIVNVPIFFAFLDELDGPADQDSGTSAGPVDQYCCMRVLAQVSQFPGLVIRNHVCVSLMPDEGDGDHVRFTFA